MKISIQGLCFGYKQRQVLRGVDLEVPSGSLCALLGANGAGKTTLLKCILGLLRYGFGSVTLDGQPITSKNIARLSFATCEHSFFPGLTAAGHRDFCAEHFPAFRAGRFQMLMDFFRLPEKRALRGFSTGQKNETCPLNLSRISRCFPAMASPLP